MSFVSDTQMAQRCQNKRPTLKKNSIKVKLSIKNCVSIL